MGATPRARGSGKGGWAVPAVAVKGRRLPLSTRARLASASPDKGPALGLRLAPLTTGRWVGAGGARLWLWDRQTRGVRTPRHRQAQLRAQGAGVGPAAASDGAEVKAGGWEPRGRDRSWGAEEVLRSTPPWAHVTPGLGGTWELAPTWVGGPPRAASAGTLSPAQGPGQRPGWGMAPWVPTEALAGVTVPSLGTQRWGGGAWGCQEFPRRGPSLPEGLISSL